MTQIHLEELRHIKVRYKSIFSAQSKIVVKSNCVMNQTALINFGLANIALESNWKVNWKSICQPYIPSSLKKPMNKTLQGKIKYEDADLKWK